MPSNKVYVYPQLSRNDLFLFRVPIAGYGIGNLLFPWARAMVISMKYRCTPIWPTWLQIRFGPILRGEKDKRFYGDLFTDKTNYVSGAKKIFTLSTYKKISESDFLRLENKTSLGKTVVLVPGMGNYFECLNGWNSEIHEKILQMLNKEYLKQVNDARNLKIAIHVRRGDFSKASRASDFKAKGGIQTPLDWFVQSLRYIRNQFGSDIPARVFSDGSQSELAALLQEKNIEFFSSNNSIVDILTMAKSKIIIGSGGSTFSAWASFLGKVPVIVYPGQSLKWFKLKNDESYFIEEFDPAGVSADLSKKIINLNL